MEVHEIIDDICRGFAFWHTISDKSCNSRDYPDIIDSICDCIENGRFIYLRAESDLYPKACYYMGFITSGEMDDWMFGGIIPNEKFPEMLIMCYTGGWDGNTVVCANVWHNTKKQGAIRLPD